MRKVTPGEMLALNDLLLMENNALAVARPGVNVITDEQLKNLAQSGITAAETRIAGLQQFIVENGLITSKEVQ